jgi:hypothetical protein
MELPPRDEFIRQPERRAYSILWDVIHAMAQTIEAQGKSVEDLERRVRLLENQRS